MSSCRTEVRKAVDFDVKRSCKAWRDIGFIVLPRLIAISFKEAFPFPDDLMSVIKNEEGVNLSDWRWTRSVFLASRSRSGRVRAEAFWYRLGRIPSVPIRLPSQS